MRFDEVRSKKVTNGHGISVATEFECGHGILSITEDGVFEIEVIAFSKDPRYFCMQVESTAKSILQMHVYPDRKSGFDFRKFHSGVWKQEEGDSEWVPLTAEELKIEDDKLTITIPMKADERLILSSEQRLPYSETSRWLKSLAGKNGFKCITIGHSVEGRSLLALERRREESPKPLVMVIAGEHGTEFAGEYLARGFLEFLLGGGEEAEELLDQYDWTFILNSNPDGNVNGWHQYNRRDWEQHAYPFSSDISWHHEFLPFLVKGQDDVSPEAVSVGDYVLQLMPSMIFNMHSWQGNDGDLGAYRAGTIMNTYPRLIKLIDQTGERLAKEVGIGYRGKDSGNLASGHLGDTLASYCEIPSLSPEAHMIIGESSLRQIGRKWLSQILLDKESSALLSSIFRKRKALYGRLPRKIAFA